MGRDVAEIDGEVRVAHAHRSTGGGLPVLGHYRCSDIVACGSNAAPIQPREETLLPARKFRAEVVLPDTFLPLDFVDTAAFG